PFSLSSYPPPPHLHSFPTRRSSDLSSRRRILFTPFRKDFPTSKPRRFFVPELSDFARCGFRRSSPEEGWDFLASGPRHMLRVKWRGIGKWRFTPPRAIRDIRSWRWNWERPGRAERLMSHRRSWMPRLSLHPPEKSSPGR